MEERELSALSDILISAKLAMSYISGREWTEFLGDIQFQDSVIMRLIMIGSASNRLSPATCAKMPQVAWQEIEMMTQKLIKEYDNINLAFVWDMVHQDLPVIVEELAQFFPFVLD